MESALDAAWRFKKNNSSDAVLATQEAMFKFQLDCDGKMHLTWLEESVLPYRQCDTVESYRAMPFTSLPSPSWIFRRLHS